MTADTWAQRRTRLLFWLGWLHMMGAAVVLAAVLAFDRDWPAALLRLCTPT